MKIQRILALIFLVAIAGCTKQTVSVGRDNPEAELEKCSKMMEDKDYEDAIKCLEIFKSRFAQTQFSEEAELKIGDAYFNKREYLLAAESYIAFLRLHPTHDKADYAYYRAGLSYLKESPKAIDRDQEYLDKAIEHLSYAAQRYPRSPYYSLASKDLFEASKRVARRNFYIGRFYYRTGEFIACIPRFQKIADNYPNSGIVDRSLYMIVKANLYLGRVEDAKTAYSKLSLDFPKSKWTAKAEKKMKNAIKK